MREHANGIDQHPVPSGWREGTVGELARGVRGVSYRPEHLRTLLGDSCAVLLRATNIQGGRIDLDDVQIIPRSLVSPQQTVNPGDIVVCMSNGSKALVGKSAPCKQTPPFLLTVGAFCSVFHPQPGASASFAAHVLQGEAVRRGVDLALAGSAINNLRNSDIEGALCRIPASCDQRRIAAVLDTVDEAIAQTEAVIAKLKRLRAGLLHDLLTRGLDANGKLRPPPDHAPHLYKDSPLGRIPREWECQPLSEMCIYIGSGVTPRGGQDVYTASGVMFIRSQNVTFDGLKLEDVAYIPRHVHDGMPRSEVFAHDVLFNITGASIGRCCPMPLIVGRANVNQHVCILRIPGATAADARVLAEILGSPIGQRQLDALNTCGNRQGLNYQQLGAFVIPWPPLAERSIIAQLVAMNDSLLRVERSCLYGHRLARSGLISDLLTGRVRVPEGAVA